MTQYKQVVCLNGHQRSIYADWNKPVKGFCTKCGKELIDACPHCNTVIKGYTSIDGVLDAGIRNIPVPKYCEGCGKPLPWTAESEKALIELVNLSQLDIQEKNELNTSIPDLISDTPKSYLAAFKWKKIGKPILDFAHDTIVDIASEATIKLLFGK